MGNEILKHMDVSGLFLLTCIRYYVFIFYHSKYNSRFCLKKIKNTIADNVVLIYSLYLTKIKATDNFICVIYSFKIK